MYVRGLHIRIEPDFPLEETARILSRILDVSLDANNSGYFEEFPAFSGVARNIHFALLGPPSPEYMVGAHYKHYDLQLLPREGKLDPSLGVEIQQRIVAQGQLRSELTTYEDDTQS